MLILNYFVINGLKKYDEHIYKKYDLSFKDTSKFDILFLGSSRTLYGINPFVIEKLTNKRTINLGLEGAKINEMELALKGYLFSHPKPSKLFLMIDPHTFGLNSESIYNKIYLSNYLSNNSIKKELIKYEGIKTTALQWMPYLILTEFDDYTRLKCIKGLLNKTQSGNFFSYNGFFLLDAKYKPAVGQFNGSKIKPNRTALLRLISICVKNNIDVQILQGAYLNSYYKKCKLDSFYINVCEIVNRELPKLKIQSQALNYDNTNYFKDETHLNGIGSTAYSIDLYNNFIKN